MVRTIVARRTLCYKTGMNYVCHVPLELATAVDPQPRPRSVAGLPGFIRLRALPEGGRRFDLSFEVEGASERNAVDAAEELVPIYKEALERYDPKVLAPVMVEPK